MQAPGKVAPMEVIPLTYRTTPGQVPTGEAQRLEPAPNAQLCVRRGGEDTRSELFDPTPKFSICCLEASLTK